MDRAVIISKDPNRYLPSMNQVVVTGMGVVTPVGTGVDTFWDHLMRGQSGVRTRPELDSTEWGLRMAAEITDFEGKLFVRPRKALKVMCRPIQFGFAAAQLAWDQSGAEGQVDPTRLSTVFGTETFYADPQEVASVFRKCIVNRVYDHDRWGEFSMQEIEPLWMLKYLPNMVASHISIAMDAQGPSNTICQSEASSLLAIAEAADLIRRGAADVVIVGGTGSPMSITGAVYRGDQLLSRRFDQPQHACRPFEKHRDGMVLGEGAGCLILERKEFAIARGAPLLAEIAGYARGFSPIDSHTFSDCLADCIRQSIKQSGLQTTDIGHVNANALSTIQDDMQEAQAIHRALNDVPVIAPKSNFGNLGPGSGAVELIASICALRDQRLPHVLNFDEADPACPLNVVIPTGNGQGPAAGQAAISLNHSRTGQIACLLVKTPQP